MTDRDLPPLDAPVRDLLAFDRDTPPVDPAVRARLRARLDASLSSPPVEIGAPRRRRRLYAALGFAAAAAAALAVASSSGGHPRRGELAATERRTVELGGRATVIAEAGASLSWQVAADGSTEVSHARGSVLYRVDPGPRFLVHTPAGDIEVAGTTFRVEVEPMNRTRIIQRTAIATTAAIVVIVSVYEGVVLLRDDAGERELAAGQTARLGAPTGPSTSGPGAAGGPSPGSAPQLDHEADPPGDLRLEGQVIDSDDEPVGGALVTIDARPPREVKTEADGSFGIDGLPPRAYMVSARLGDRYAGPVTASLSDHSEPVTLRLRQGSTLEVSVLDRERRPIAGAQVEATDLPGVSATTGGDGRARLLGMAPGFTEITASASGFGPGGRMVALAGKAGTTERTEIELAPGGPLSGTVVDAEARPVEGATVRAQAASRGLMSWSDPEVTTDASGRFAFPALATGTYGLAAEHPRHAPGSITQVAHDAARPTEGVEIRLARGAALAGRVVTADGEPAGFAALRIATAGRRFERLRAVQADASGRFHIDGLPRAAIEVAATHARGSASQTIDLAVGESDREIEIALLPGQVIAGVVVDGGGAPVADAQLMAVPATALDDPGSAMLHGSNAVLTDQGGRFEIAGLADGAYQLKVTRPGRARGFSVFRSDASASAHTGDRAIRIVLPEEGSITGKLVFADGTPVTEFTVSQFMAPGAIPFSSPDGTFRIDEVAPGEHRLLAAAPGAVAREIGPVVVEPGKVLDAGKITLSRGRTVSGRVVGSDGKPVEGARVELAQFLIDAGESGLDRPGENGGVTDRDGGFTIRGAATTELTIAARHPGLGLSRAAAIPAGPDDRRVELTIEGPGSIEGRVTRGGRPLPALISARALDGDVSAIHTVKTDEDGGFRFDRLAPGRWGLSAQAAEGGVFVLGGDDRSLATASVATGKVARADIELGGKVTLSIRVKDAAGADRSALVLLIGGKASAANRKQLAAAMEQAGGPGNMQIAPVLLGEGQAPPSRFDNVDPGSYTVCTTALPRRGTGGALELDDDETVPVACTPLEVAPTPDRQAATVRAP